MRKSIGYVASLAAFLLITAPAVAGSPTSAPATRPADTAIIDPVRFTPPPSPWEKSAQSLGPRNLAYLAGKWGVLGITVGATDMGRANAATAKEMGDQLIKTLNEGLKKRQIKVLQAPHIEPDPKYFLKIRDRFEHPVMVHGKMKTFIADELHLYRIVARRLVTATVSVTQPDDGQKARLLQDGEDFMLAAEPAKASRK